MRITFLATNYAPSVGGAQLHVQRVAEGLVARHGHDVSVLTTDAWFSPTVLEAEPIPVREELLNGVHVRRLSPARRVHVGLRGARRAARRVHLWEPDGPTLLSVGPLSARLAVEAGRAGRRSDVVVGVSVPSAMVAGADLGTRGTTAARVVMPLLHLSTETPRPWALRTMRRADGCTASTAFERDWLVRHGVPSDRLAVLPPGCDPERYPDLGPRAARASLGLPDGPTIGFVGRFAPNKGLETLSRAMVRVWRDHPGVNLLLAGSRAGWAGLDPWLSELREVAGDRLVLRVGFDEADKPALLSACDVIAFPSRDESFGMVIIEAWCARRAVVASDIEAIRSLIEPGVTGDLVPVGDAGVLASHLAALLEDPSTRTRWGATGRELAESRFSWSHVVDSWDGFLRDSVERRRVGSSRPARSRWTGR